MTGHSRPRLLQLLELATIRDLLACGQRHLQVNS